jgi:hypothetical protein
MVLSMVGTLSGDRGILLLGIGKIFGMSAGASGAPSSDRSELSEVPTLTARYGEFAISPLVDEHANTAASVAATLATARTKPVRDV